MMRVIGQRISLYSIAFALSALPNGAFADSSSVEDFTAIVNTGSIKQTTSGSGNRQDLNVGSANSTKANSFNATVTTGAIAQSSSGTGIVQSANIGSANSAKVGSFTSTVTTGKIEQISTRSGDRQELDIGSVNNSIVNGSFKVNVNVKEGVKQTGSGEIVLGSVKNSNVQDFSTTLDIKGKVTGNNIRIGSIVGGERFENASGLMDKPIVGIISTETHSGISSQFKDVFSNTATPLQYLEDVKKNEVNPEYVALKLADLVYNPINNDEVCDARQGVSKCNPTDNKKRWILLDYRSTSTGFNGAVFMDKKTNQIIMSFGGTTADKSGNGKLCSIEGVKDIITDITLIGNQQVKDAKKYYAEISSKYEINMMTGHSLGGRLAQEVAYDLGTKSPATYTINTAPVGVHTALLDGAKSIIQEFAGEENSAFRKITNMRTKNDPLTTAFGNGFGFNQITFNYETNHQIPIKEIEADIARTAWMNQSLLPNVMGENAN